MGPKEGHPKTCLEGILKLLKKRPTQGHSKSPSGHFPGSPAVKTSCFLHLFKTKRLWPLLNVFFCPHIHCVGSCCYLFNVYPETHHLSILPPCQEPATILGNHNSLLTHISLLYLAALKFAVNSGGRVN